MNSLVHFAVNVGLSIPLQAVFHWTDTQVALFVASGVIIDFDHIIFALAKFRPFMLTNIRKQIKYRRGNMIAALYIFHSPELNLLLVVVSLWVPMLRVVVLSNMIHLLLDSWEHYTYHRTFNHFYKWSITAALLRKQRGR